MLPLQGVKLLLNLFTQGDALGFDISGFQPFY